MPTTATSKNPGSRLKKDRLASKEAPVPVPVPAVTSNAPVSGRRAAAGANAGVSPQVTPRTTNPAPTSGRTVPALTPLGSSPSGISGSNNGGAPHPVPLSGRKSGHVPPLLSTHSATTSTTSSPGRKDVSPSQPGISPQSTTTTDRKNRSVNFGSEVDLARGLEIPMFTESIGSDTLAHSGSLTEADAIVRTATPEFLKNTTGNGGAVKDETIDAKLNRVMEGVRQHWGLIRRQSQMGSPSDAQLKEMEKERLRLEKVKKDAAKEINSWGTCLSLIRPDDILEDFGDFLDRLVLETDARGGNLELVKTCLTHFSPAVNFPTMISEKQWIINSAADGSIGYIELFLCAPGVSDVIRDDVQEIVQTACYNQSCRIPLVNTLFKYDTNVLKFEKHKEELEDVWQEFFVDIASSKKAIPREDRSGRMEVLTKLVMHPHIVIDYESEGADGDSIFTRAANEGDLDVLRLLLEKNKIKNVNAVLSDNCTALIRASFRNHVACVKLLLLQPGIDKSHACSEGTALQLAKTLQRDPQIIAALSK